MSMKNKYVICELQICKFSIIENEKKIKLYKADRDNYPYRLCVFNEEEKIAIDVETEKAYEYIEMSLMYFIGNEAKRIEDGKRYAILPLRIEMSNHSEKDYKKAQNIIKKLNSGVEFAYGNIQSNEDYLEMINKKEKKKIKRR